jgi:hypothetical protein
MSFLEEFNQVSNDTTVATVKEGSRETSVTSTTSTTDSVDIVVDVGWQVVVDDMRDVTDIETT